MEVGLEGEKSKPPEGENKTKRKMKTASQLEILEKTYAEEAYPPESLRAELSVKLGLSDRQLQMWFCHRRLKERKATPTLTSGKRPRKDSQAAAVVAGGSGEEMAAEDLGNEHASGQGSGPITFGHAAEPPRYWGAGPRARGDMLPPPAMKRCYEPQQTIAGLRAIAFVEAQLGEPLREDGPILGMEFDPLPPDAFGMPIEAAMVGQHKQSGRPFDAKIYDHLDAKPVKGAARALHEYQFIPEQPSVRTVTCERHAPPSRYGSPADVPNARTSSLSTGHMYLHGNEHLSSGYGIQGQINGLNQLPQQARENHFLPSASGQHDSVQRKNLLTNTSTDAYLGTHPINQLENPFIAPAKRIINEEDNARIERKRKSEEARLAREVEAHEKRIRKELEKQDILRRKREEQIRKEMERHDRERWKEEERLLREKQREEERYQREQRRELERREKFLQKESIRAEKMRQKEELRREREAARLRASHQRAIARRIAKESMELIEDERLELMELAASSKRLPSILSLDYEILQNLELYRDLQIAFPPKSLHLKKPFAIQPWTDSEDNIGSLLMVWRFLITFADILGLWPFTLDEFIQAFHDYDTRLLGEINISLLRSIIKDIEDVARTPSTGLGANHTSAANPGGGHPLIVEWAYAWGFNIRSWQCHLNPLTWPEILRQFALSAGFGPQLKKRNIEPSHLRDDNEGNDGKDVVSNLRSGAAVENAFAKMQERGFSNPRRSRHRLTPGTVKFAAFHVLSLEGERGLTILEVADRIQKSGLRDLTACKTPEASISTALSRDTKLFERTAPSTYCVRAVYRKDPADAEAILSAARERIGTFKSGFFDGEDANDGERDEDSESDVAEDLDIDDLGTDVNPESNFQSSQEVNKLDLISLLENGKGSVEIIEMPEKDCQNIGASCVKTKDPYSSLGQSVDNIESCNDASVDHEDADIDESNTGEPWVQGLIEGEYSDLSVEERLNALVAIIGVAVEGNSIRLVLEERLEAANALKKQMWAKMQLDKRRMKEEFVTRMHYSSAMVSKCEPNLANTSAEGRQSSFVTVDDKNNKTIDNLAVQEERISDALDQSHRVSSFPSEGNLQMQEVPAGAENHVFHQPGYAVERSQSQLKSYIGHKAEEMYVYRSLPLGQDRRHNRYWQFITSASQNDPGCGRIFVELHDSRWRLIDSEEAFDALLASLDIRGVRESRLQMMLQKVEIPFKKAVRKKMLRANMRRQSEDMAKMEALEMTPHPHSSIGTDSLSSTLCIADSDGSETSTFEIELGRNKNESNGALKRYQDLERWIWKECCSSSMLCAIKQGKKRCRQLLDFCDDCHGIYSSEEDHCPSCHITYGTLEKGVRFSEHVAQCKGDQNCSLHGSPAFPPRIRLLKILLALIEVSVPREALQSLWTRSHRESWGLRLNTSSSVEDLLEVLTILEGAVTREFLFSDFETTRELLDSLNPGRYAATSSASPETITVLPWVPRTTAAVALRVMEFDAAIFYVLQHKVESQKDKGSDVIKLSSKHAFGKSLHSNETLETPGQGHHVKEDYWDELGIGLTDSGNGRGILGRGRGRTRGSRSQRRAIGSTSSGDTAKKRNGILGQGVGWKGRQHGRGRKRSRRSIRSRRKPAKRIVQTGVVNNPPEENVSKKSPRSLVYRWNAADTTGFRLEGAEPVSSSGRSDNDDESGHGLGDEYKETPMDDYASGFNGKSVDLEGSESNMDGVEEEVDGDYNEDEEGYNAGKGYDIGEEEQGDFDVDRYIYGDSEEEENRAGG